jgi:hypothetical protein
VAVGPLDLQVVESANKAFLNFVFKHARQPLQRRLEVELNKPLNANLDPLCKALNDRILEHAAEEMKQTAKAQAKQKITEHGSSQA